jgi:hypothetical protein
VHRLAVRDDHELERELEQLPQPRKRPLLVPRRRPDAQLSSGRGQRVREDQRALLGEPERRLVAAAAVVEGDESAPELVPGIDRLQLRLRDVVGEEELGAERASPVAPREEVDVAHVVGLEHDDSGRRARVQPFPDLAGFLGRRERVEDGHFATRFDAGRGDERLPLGLRRPVGMLGSPEPEAGRDVAELVAHGAHGARRSSVQAPSAPRL